MIIDILLQDLPPAPNRSSGAHWSQRSKSSKLHREWAWGQAREQLRTAHIATATVKRSCRIEIIYPASRKGPVTDPDSALARMKPLIDGLVDAGCLRGDTAADVVYAPVEQRKEGKRLIVRFTLEDVA